MARRTANAAVREKRAPKIVEADDPQTKLYRALDYYPTPPWAARAGAEIVRYLDPLAKTIWEPACGEGHMAEPLREYFSPVIATDIHDHGRDYPIIDFLLAKAYGASDIDWIVTNPPFLKAAEFVSHGLQIARRGVAVLCRLSFLESETRYRLLFQSLHPLSHVAYFVERVPMVLGEWNPKASTATAYAWFIFDKSWPRVRAPELVAIPPGTRARLSRDADVLRFAIRKPVPLLMEGGEICLAKP